MGHGMNLRTDTMVANSRGKPIWHDGMGTKIKYRDGLITPSEAREEAFPWDVMAVPAYFNAGDGQFMKAPEDRFIVRTDLPTNDPDRILGCVGKKYTIIPNSEPVDLANAISGYGACVDTASSLHGGRRIYMSLVIPGVIKVKDDTLQQYLILTNTHDGTTKFTMMMVPIRVVCQNTLAAAFRSKSCYIGIVHSEKYEDRIKVALASMTKATDYFRSHGEIMNELANIRLSREQSREYFRKVLDIKKGKNGKESARGLTALEKIEHLFNGGQDGADQDAVKGTLYGAYNAFTQWLERDRSTRVHGAANLDAATKERMERENRIESVLFTSGADMRDRAMSSAVAMLN